METEILEILKSNPGDYVSGQYISGRLGVTRAAVWKEITKLKEAGYDITSSTKKGYILNSCPDILTYEEVKQDLTTKTIGRRIIHLQKTASTNDYAKQLAAHGEAEGTVVAAEGQEAGRGRMGREWYSPEGRGIYFTLILRPDIELASAALLTQISAAAVGLALENLGLIPLVKWPNDIFLGNRKVCGILTEVSGEINCLNDMVIGIGLNVNNETGDFSDEALARASSLKLESGRTFRRSTLLAGILNHFEPLYYGFLKKGSAEESLDYCRRHSLTDGRRITVVNSAGRTSAKVTGLNDKGQLMVAYSDGRRENLTGGEVSLEDCPD